MQKGTVKSPGSVWVQTKEPERANYDNLGEGWMFIINFVRWYPDFLLDLCRSEEADYDLALIQRIIMRAKARHQYCDIIGCRGLTKSYCSISEEMVEMNVYPGIKTAYYGPSFRQTAKIASQTYKQIEKEYPVLTEQFDILSDSTDKFEIQTKIARSSLAITSFRGDTTSKVVAEEVAQENPPRFDEDAYKSVVLPAVRHVYMVRGKRDPVYIPFKQHTITSAGRRQNFAYETRSRHYVMMQRGESAFVMDVPFDVVLLSLMRPVSWAESKRTELTPDEWAREMESRCTGGDQNPLIPDNTLTECRCLSVMEEHHCCKDYNNQLELDDVFYIIGYDVSYADGAINAKCACTVVKCTKQKEWLKRDKYLKQAVWVDDWLPKSPMEQATMLKKIWYRYCCEGHHAYIAIDAWQYGSAVVQALMMDLGDGLDPLCTMNHTLYPEYELDNAIPIIYPVKAGGVGTTDPDADMIRNAEIQFDNHNVELLTSNIQEGIDEYKKLHRIKDDRNDYLIYQPYKKTNELVGQIQNLKKVQNASGTGEKRISSKIQRDSWSALKYALRLAQILERTYLSDRRKNTAWEEELKKYQSYENSINKYPVQAESNRKLTRIPFLRRGGRAHAE